MVRRSLINVALGREPADAIVAGGQVVSVHTERDPARRCRDRRQSDRGSWRFPVRRARGPQTRIIDADGLFVSPGLIDGHLHYHHTYLDPAEASKLLLRHGITGTADGFYGEAIVGGAEAVRALKQAADKLKIRLIFLAPTSAYLQNRMFGLKPAKAVSIADLHEMLDWDGCYGLDETPFSSVIDKDDGMLGLFEATLAKGKVVTGHVRGADRSAGPGLRRHGRKRRPRVGECRGRAGAGARGHEGADALWLRRSRPAQPDRRLHGSRNQPASIGALHRCAFAGSDVRGRRRCRRTQDDRCWNRSGRRDRDGIAERRRGLPRRS